MNQQQKLSLFAIGLSLLAIFSGPVGAAAAAAPGAYDALKADSASGVYLTTGQGTSMEPTMSPGDRAVCVEWVTPEIGNVVGVDPGHGDPEMRHRVVELNESHVVTKGDGNDYRDDPLSRENIRCTVVYSEGAGWWP